MGKKKEITEAVLALHRSVKRTSTLGSWHGDDRAQGRTLKVISENDGARATEIARLLNLSPSSMSDRLSRLEEDGNIVRKRDKKDMRVVRVFITAKGKKIVEERSNVGTKNGPDFTKVLTKEEQKTFVELCKKLTKSLDDIYFTEKNKLLEIKKLELELDEFKKADTDAG